MNYSRLKNKEPHLEKESRKHTIFTKKRKRLDFGTVQETRKRVVEQVKDNWRDNAESWVAGWLWGGLLMFSRSGKWIEMFQRMIDKTERTKKKDWNQKEKRKH